MSIQLYEEGSFPLNKFTDENITGVKFMHETSSM